MMEHMTVKTPDYLRRHSITELLCNASVTPKKTPKKKEAKDVTSPPILGLQLVITVIHTKFDGFCVFP